MSFEELLAVVDDIDAETRKFDFAGVHAANIHPFFHRNDGRAAERVADVLVGANDRRQPFVSLSSALRGTRPNPSVGQIAKGAASLLFGSARDRTVAHLVQSGPARQAHRAFRRRGLLERIAAHDKARPVALCASNARACAKTGLPLASIAIEKRPARA